MGDPPRGSPRGIPKKNGKSPHPDLGVLIEKKSDLFGGGQMLLSDGLVLMAVYIVGVCGPRYAHPWPWGSCFCQKVRPAKWPPSFQKKGENPHPGFANLSTKNGFGLSDGHIGSSGGENRGSRTNSAARTLPWACRPLGTSFSPLSTSGDLGPGPSPGPLGALYNSRSTHLGGPVCYYQPFLCWGSCLVSAF